MDAVGGRLDGFRCCRPPRPPMVSQLSQTPHQDEDRFTFRASPESQWEAMRVLAPMMLISGISADAWSEANPGFLAFTGVSPEDAAERRWDRILRSNVVRRVLALLSGLQPGEPPARSLRVCVLRRDGVFRWCELRAYRPASGDDSRWFVAMMDVHAERWAAIRMTRLRRALEAGITERQTLVRKIVVAQEEERARMAAELHDHLGQSLTALKMAISGDALRRQATGDSTVLLDLLQETERQLDLLTLSLRPYLLEVSGLQEALSTYLGEWSAQHAVATDLNVSPSFPRRLAPHLEVGFYRIILAALNNVARHAHARHVRVSLGRIPGALIATVEDDGAGFDVDSVLATGTARKRSGTVIMEQRARLLGGTCTWDSAAGHGTRVRVRVPHQPPSKSPPRDRQ